MTYPNLLRRYLASIIDMLTVSLFIYLYVKSPLYSPGGVGVLVALILLLSFEPLMTVFLCTPGQALMRFRVRHAESFTRISLGSAYLRVLTKYALGMITFFYPAAAARPPRDPRSGRGIDRGGGKRSKIRRRPAEHGEIVAPPQRKGRCSSWPACRPRTDRSADAAM